MRISNKTDFFEEVKVKLQREGFRVIGQDFFPWGGTLQIDEEHAHKFADTFFASKQLYLPQRPKILVIAPGKAIHWQYHLRRSEFWQVLVGEVGIVVSKNDEEQPLRVKSCGEVVQLHPGDRHRLVGLNDWGVVAQLWKHSNLAQPSDDGDVVRLASGFTY
ncbi:phosphoheptose isomerase [Olivibacter sp. SDN3]|uniref:phosphoheptose isomerase n=1 Tax=Olivibacter sp. SDN3 TaxID=2764720 RepID=UPI001650F8AB|nr:phosphoheptose isomerase [Olivibacter sp. SDN3]QNL51621.1 phosphoheptose isomerase [Olivibacter sp. SDN3]